MNADTRRPSSDGGISPMPIASFLSPDADERQEAAITKRLDRIDRNVQRFEGDMSIANQAFAIFMRSWLTSTASLTEVGQAVHVKGGERYDRLLEFLGRRIAKEPRLRQEVPEDISKAHLSSDKPDGLFHVPSCDLETSRMPVAELLLFRNFHGKRNMFSYFTLHVIKPDFADPVGQLCRENMTFSHNLLISHPRIRLELI